MSDVLLAVGTGKGLFLGWSEDRHTWSWEGPHHPMQPLAGVAIDTREPVPRLLVGGRDEQWTPTVLTSDDLGVSWAVPKVGAIAFPPGITATVEQIWQVQPSPASRPDEVWAGVEPAAAFRSGDGGESFGLVGGLWEHPDRPLWKPCGGGLCLHTIVPHATDADRILVAISAGGIYRTTDGGTTWEPANEGIAARTSAHQDTELPPCVHKVAADPKAPDHLLLQDHSGVYRSSNWGDNWQHADTGLPATFGFGIARTADGSSFISPLATDTRRLPVDGRGSVAKSDDNGQSWHDSSQGLPTYGFHTSVLRDALTTDGLDPEGVYFGTRSGEIWASRDSGREWRQVASHLPDVLCVRAAGVAAGG